LAGPWRGGSGSAPGAFSVPAQGERERDAAVLSVVLTAFAIAVLWVTGKLTRRRIGP
jgi:hypothetical protein